MARFLVSQILESAGAFSMLLRVRGVVRSPWVTVLTYHRVAVPSGGTGLYDGVVDARPEAFERQLTFLGRHCTVISLEELLEFRKGARLPPNPVLITFDDGYLDNHNVALPILQRHKMKATFFIATHYINERRLFWWDHVSYVLKLSKKENLELTYPRKLTFALGTTEAERIRAVRRVLAIIKSHFGLDFPRFIEEIEKASGVTLSADVEEKKVDELLMNWDHVRALKRAGMAVESHTRTHRVLQTLSRRELNDELGGSREELEGILGSKVSAVAYPVGYGLEFAPEARLAVRAAGYELGFSNNRGMNLAWKFDPLDVKRMSLELDLPDSYFRGMVALPYFAYAPDARGRVSRV